MSDGNLFASFVSRIRAGDQEAAAELVRRFEPLIRREARLRLRDPRLRRVIDSMDISQSVLASFFVRAVVGQYDLERPDHLMKLLVGMVCKKVAFQVRRSHAQRRDHRRLAEGAPEELVGADDSASPSRLVAGKDLLHEFRMRLTEEERRLADYRAEGRPWAEIAARLGGTPATRCQQLARAVRRVARELRLEGEDDE